MPFFRMNTGDAGRLRHRVVDQARHVQRELVFAADAIEQVVEDAPAAANDRPLSSLIDDADRAARSCSCPASPARGPRASRRDAKTRLPVPAGLKFVCASLRLERRRDEVVAQADVDRQLVFDLPVVLHEAHRRPVPLLDDPDVRELEAGRRSRAGSRPSGLPVNVLRKRIAPRVAGTSMYWFFIGAMMSAPNLNAWLPRSHDSVSMNSNWFGVLELRQEVRRSETAEARPAEVAVDRDAREPAGDERVGDHSGNLRRGRRRDAERLMHRVRLRARPREADFVHHRAATARASSRRRRRCVLIFWLPKADVPVPSMTPPNAPGISRSRFE